MSGIKAYQWLQKLKRIYLFGTIYFKKYVSFQLSLKLEKPQKMAKHGQNTPVVISNVLMMEFVEFLNKKGKNLRDFLSFSMFCRVFEVSSSEVALFRAHELILSHHCTSVIILLNTIGAPKTNQII